MFPGKDATLKAEKEEWALASKDVLEVGIKQRGKELFWGGIAVVSRMLHR